MHELHHHFLQLAFSHLPMAHRDAGAGTVPEFWPRLPDCFHSIVNEIDLPFAVEFLFNRRLDQLVVPVATTVWIAIRSLGSVSITLMSRNPTSDMCSVRGIGVADMVSTSTWVRICLIRSL